MCRGITQAVVAYVLLSLGVSISAKELRLNSDRRVEYNSCIFITCRVDYISFSGCL